jgi:hypothetical protein
VAVEGGNWTTAGCVAPGRNGLVPNGRASKPGTAARATTKFGSDPNPATSTRARTTRAGLTYEIARLVRLDSARAGYGAPTKPFRGTRRGRFYEQPKVIHTHEIDVMGLHRRSNNNGVHFDRVDNWLGCLRSRDWATASRQVVQIIGQSATLVACHAALIG